MPEHPGQENETCVGEIHCDTGLYKIVFDDGDEEELEETNLRVSVCAYSPG